VRDRTHWNIINIKPTDPVLLGICKQTELETEIGKAAAAKRKLDTSLSSAKQGGG